MPYFFCKNLTLSGSGFLVCVWFGGGGFRPTDIMSCRVHICHRNQPKMVSNESWDLETPTESLKTTLCFIIFPYWKAKCAQFDSENFQLCKGKILKFHNFLSTYTIYTSNKSWNHSKFKFDIYNMICFEFFFLKKEDFLFFRMRIIGKKNFEREIFKKIL